jgi:hypothetical protein
MIKPAVGCFIEQRVLLCCDSKKCDGLQPSRSSKSQVNILARPKLERGRPGENTMLCALIKDRSLLLKDFTDV